jgi:hypothetical protein
LERLAPGSEYDLNFFGGIDELLPNDLAESWDDIAGLDHGELWTSELSWSIAGDRLQLSALLPRCGLFYERELALSDRGPWLDCSYRITNRTTQRRRFLWKLHAALAVQEGDIIECPAHFGQVVDPAWSRFKGTAPFCWPSIEGCKANVVPPANGTMDFFYLFDLPAGQIALRRPGSALVFAYRFDLKTFPYAWLFASYGGFAGHYTVILEPCTAMPLSVREAAAVNQCSVLEPGEVLETHVEILAGHARVIDPLLKPELPRPVPSSVLDQITAEFLENELGEVPPGRTNSPDANR